MKIKKMFYTVICTKGGEILGRRFRIGEVYPVLGYNNGIQVGYMSEGSDAEIVYCHSYDRGDGTTEEIPVMKVTAGEIISFDELNEDLPHFEFEEDVYD